MLTKIKEWVIKKLIKRSLNVNNLILILKSVLSLKALEGHRTKIAFVLLFIVGGLRASGLVDQWVDQKTFDAIVSLLSGAGVLAASVHKTQ